MHIFVTEINNAKLKRKRILLMVSQSFSKISKRHQRGLHAWSRGNGEWRVCQCHATICRL